MHIILLHSLNGARGLANGTRSTFKGVSRNVVDTEIATGSHAHVGRTDFIPRIILTPSENGTLVAEAPPILCAAGICHDH